MFEKTLENRLFDLEKFDIKLDTDTIGRHFIYAQEVPSTNTELLNNKNDYDSNGTVIFAENQTKGKGRMNRQWYSTKNMNLTFSILITDPRYLRKKVNMLNYSASLAVALSIENLFQLHTELKWPNDVLIAGKKVAGILIESTSSGSKIDRLVLGIGINVNQSSFQGKFTLEPTSIRNELGHSVERERVLAEVLNHFEELLGNAISSPNIILNEWRERCGMIGKHITVMNDENTKRGIFEDIDEDGFLILRSTDKTETLHFGDVSIR
jgi:BirA family biotin operon repressor/biotin-[acetyl-CoA-carboxylase] ligase